MNRHIWPGLFTSRANRGERNAWPAAEVTNQIRLTRWRPQATGHVHFSMKALQGDRAPNLAEQLKERVYGTPALVPASPWLGTKAPGRPEVTVTGEGSTMTVSWRPTGGVKTWQYAVWSRHGDQWQFHVLPAEQTSIQLTDDAGTGPVTQVVVSAVDRLGNEGARVAVARPATMKYPWPGLTTRPAK